MYIPTRYRGIFLTLAIAALAILGISQTAYALVNINTASSDELETLTGIGPTYAERIIDYRESSGNFQKIEDIKNIKGIGDVTFNKIKDYITVGGEGDIASGGNTNTTSNGLSESKNSPTYSPVFNTAKIKTKFTASAGGDRLGSVGSPLEFRAETNIDDNSKVKFTWSFGDGTEDQGEVVEHTYMYPSEYVVVLNAFLTGEHATSRTNVKITAAELSLAQISSGQLEIANNSKEELSLYGRAIVSKDKIFKFPKDTIIKPGQRIIFSSAVTGINSGSDITLEIVNTQDSTEHILSIIQGEKERKIASISKTISSLENQIAEVKKIVQEPISNQIALANKNNEISEVSETAAAVQALENTNVGGFKKIFRQLKNFFLKNRYE